LKIPARRAESYSYANFPAFIFTLNQNKLNSASNDIGFARDGNGVYRALISEYDRGIGFDDAWLGRLSQTYKERQTIAVAKSKGYRFLGRQVIDTQAGKKVQLRFAVR
jgi:hypothetical protein